jgi:hypothetical protein
MSSVSFPTIQSFVTEGGGDPSELDDLVKDYYTYPAPLTQTKPYHPPRYAQYSAQDICRNNIADLIMQHILSPLSNPYDPVYRQTNHSFGFSMQDKKSQMETFLFRHALQFTVLKIGNCARRACYASLVLVKILPENAKVFVISNPKKDQFVVQLSLKPKEWHVYDPFTNPERVFPHNVYTRNILSLFPDVPRQAEAFVLQVTKELSNTFYSNLPALMQKVHAQFFSTFPTESKLLNSRPFVLGLQTLTSSNPSASKEQLSRSLALIQTNATVPLPAATPTSAVAAVSSSSDLQQNLEQLQISSTQEKIL